MTEQEQEALSTFSRAWHPVTARWVSNGCTLTLEQAELALKGLVKHGAVARLKRRGIDEHGFDYVYHAYILPERIVPWMTS